MKPLLVKILFFLVILIAIADGVLLARHFYDKPEPVAEEIIVVEEEPKIIEEEPVLDEPEPEIEAVEQEWPSLNFTTQAPYGWFSPWTYYAEEASMIMALETFNSPQEAGDAISSLASWMQSNIGNTRDNSIEELQRTVREYYQVEAYIMQDPSVVTLMTELDQGGLILLPIHGPSLENPNYGNPAPEHHVFLVYGYTSEGFLTNDPGTVKGEAAVYDYEKILESIQDLDGEKRALLIQPS